MMDFSPVGLRDFINKDIEKPDISDDILESRHKNSLHR